MNPSLLVLHDVGDAAGSGPWAAALVEAGWRGRIVAPDLPGHAGAPPPVGGHHEMCDAAFVASAVLGDLGSGPLVALGVGTNGWSAQVLALGGRATALVLVDGLGAPWLDADEVVQLQIDRLRAIADDPAALAPAPAGVLDPRLRHGVGHLADLDFARRAAAATPVPVLVIETPASAATPAERRDLVARFPAGGELVEVDEANPRAVARAVVGWAA